MKRLIAWPLVLLLFHLGAAAGCLINWLPESMYVRGMYQLYNKPMLWSVRLNNWAGLSLWTKPS